MRDAFLVRERALEEAFFTRLNNEKIEVLKKKTQHDESVRRLSKAIGITDERVLDEILDLNLDVSSVSALTLAPLVAVAWMDKTLTAVERHEIIVAAHDFGIEENSEAHQALLSWLEHEPPENFLEAWADYVRALIEAKGAKSLDAFREDIYDKTKALARRAGGFFGLGCKVTADGEKILRKVRLAFES